jgi:thiol-disulfide isomerase/thioredoxin
MAIFRKKTKPISLEHPDQVDEFLATGKPVLLDFYQYGCRPCQVMDGVVNELAGEFGDSAIVVKANAAHVPGLFEKYKVKSTPTFLLLTRREGANAPTQRFRASGLVKKDVLAKTMVSNGAVARPD